MPDRTPNHLIDQNSPYLLQHAWNPVDWHPWTYETLNKAREENKLLVISIGYASCHWCHVMEHESFEDADVALAMNSRYISVKVDREERPDVDHVYMNACQVLSGRGGWPLNVIALPDQRPVFAGTYFSKRDWIHILDHFADIHRLHPGELDKMAIDAMQGIRRAIYLPAERSESEWGKALPDEIFNVWESDLDYANGGTRGAPKFPMPANLSALLSYGYRSKNERVATYLQITLEKMAMGGIYDQAGGGFSRYSVDGRWEVPHFEKMLYDNGQIISLYSQAFRVRPERSYKRVIEETIGFIDRELTSSEGLFYASIDADSEGAEGKFYTWSEPELSELFTTEVNLFSSYFSCEPGGNWEHGRNVLRRTLRDHEFSNRFNLTEEQLSTLTASWKVRVMAGRATRVRPATDDKIITAWNGLMISGLVDAYLATNDNSMLDRALRAARFYLDRLAGREGELWRNYKNQTLNLPGFLDDYAFLIKSFLDLYQATFDHDWNRAAEVLIRRVIDNFSIEGGVFFQLSSAKEQPLIHQAVELSDNVIPASNSQMAWNLYVFGHLSGNPDYISRSENMVTAMLPQMKRNPGFHANWVALLGCMMAGPIEVAVIGPEWHRILQEFRGFYHPGIIFSGSDGRTELPGFSDRFRPGETLIYICLGRSCFAPVKTVADAILLINQ